MPKLSKFKVVLVGDQNVGKTSIISRFIHDSFEQTSNPTVGIDFITKTMQIEGETLRLQLWDTAGQERFRSLIPSYVRDADCCLLIIDLSSRNTFEGLDKWHDFVRETRGQDGLIYLVGNKLDLDREIDKKEAESFAEINGISYIEVSAKNSTNISTLFRKLAEGLLEAKKANSPGDQGSVSLNTTAKEEENRKITLKKQNKSETGRKDNNACRC